MNNDGLIDIVVGDRSGKVFLYTRNDDGTLHGEGAFEGVAVNFNSAPTVADWNGDGLLDMLVGSQGIFPTFGVVYYYINNGTKENPQFTGGGGAILDEKNGWIYHYRAQPRVFDLDEDGVQEIIVGEADGNFYYHENIGTNEKPVITQGVSLGLEMDSDCRLSFTDWNEDGVTDIVAGDYGKYVYICLGEGETSINNSVNVKRSYEYISCVTSGKKLTVSLKEAPGTIQSVKLLNSMGQVVAQHSNFGQLKSKSVELPKPASGGVHFLYVATENRSYSHKVTLY